MKITADTMKILQNFAAIQPNFKALPNAPIQTMNDSKTLLSVATLDAPFDNEFRVYDMNEFLAVHNFMKDPEIIFDNESVIIKDEKSEVNYRFCHSNIMTYPDKAVNEAIFANAECKVKITQAELTSLKKMSGILKCDTITISSDGTKIIGKIANPKLKSHKYAMVLCDTGGIGKEYDFIFLIHNLKFIEGDYEVSIATPGISMWEHTTANLKYYVALENTSSFDNQKLNESKDNG